MHGTASAAGMVKDMKEEEERLGRQLDGWPCPLQVHAIRRSTENYRILPAVRRQALLDLGVPQDWIQLDLFACKQNTTHEVYVTKHMDAFAYNWSKLLVQPHHVMWANPPFSLLDKVITKVNKGALSPGAGDT